MIFFSNITIVWISCLYFLVIFEKSFAADLSKCDEKETCGDCIQTVGCAWCAAQNFTAKDRCADVNKIQEKCPQKDIQNPEPAEPESRPRMSQTEKDTVRIKPWKYIVSGRIGDKVNVTMTFEDEAKKPLDLYFLLDSSCTMNTVIESVKNSASNLARKLREITSDLQLGLGGFVDKPVMPFIGDPDDVNRSGGCGNTRSIGTYGYRNYLKLSTLEAFLGAINNHQISFNRDLPEGGFDALLQAVVCDHFIGWRNDSVRLIVLATDAEFHIAGDGKLGGIILPHDGNCHMAPKTVNSKIKYDEYTHSTKLDYPSIALLNKKIKEKKVRVIFAVKDHNELYTELSSLIEGSSIAQLQVENDRDSIQKIVHDEFEKLNSVVELRPFPENECFKIKYYVQCNSAKDFVAGGKCLQRNKLSGSREITFNIEIEFKKCPTSNTPRCNRNIDIEMIGITQKKLAINLEPICDCNCADRNNNANGKTCQNGGELNCGICECPKNFCGANCETRTDDDPNRKSCRQGGVECSDQGTCKCGKCDCNQNHFGPFCEYNKTKCPTYNGLICSGVGDERCKAETIDTLKVYSCECPPEYKGKQCECSLHKTNCDLHTNGQVCNNKGTCECNECKCLDGYTGSYCDKCVFDENLSQYTQILNSQSFTDCIQCHLKERVKSKCTAKCSGTNGSGTEANVTSVEFVDAIDSGCGDNSKSCGIGYVASPNSNCLHNFTYTCTPWNKNSLQVLLNKKDLCPVPANLFAIFVGVGGAILLIGILTLLLWRLAAFVYDRKEYERFQKETRDAKWNQNENPLFKPVLNTFQNPTYNTTEQSQILNH